MTSTPLPMPASRCGTSASTIRKKPTSAKDWPKPAMTMAGAMSRALTCGQSSRTVAISHTSPIACSTRPDVTTRRPYRAISRGATSVPAKNATAIGVIATPDCRALSCSPDCTVSAKTNMNAPNPMKNATARVSPRRIERTLTSDGGMSGAPPARSVRRSTTAVATAATGATASSNQIHSGQCKVRPSVSGTSSATSVMPSSVVPGRSTPDGCGERVAGTWRRVSRSTATPTGTFTRKIGRHDRPAMSAFTSTPPSSWPIDAAIPPTDAYRPIARARL